MKEKRILLVEDNPDDELLTLRALRTSDIASRVDVARDGAEALEYLFENQGKPLPELVLLDLKLPKIDGLEVLRRIRNEEATKLLPVVVLTTSDEQRDIVESYKLGANSYIRKPVDFQRFSESICQLGIYWLALNESPTRVDFA